MAIVTKRGKRLLSTKRLRVGVDVGGTQGGAYQELVGTQSVSHDVGSRSVEQVDFFGDTAAETGSRTVEPFTVGLGTLLDHMRVYRGLQAADEAGRPVRVRVDVYGYELVKSEAGKTWEVTAPGATDPAKAKGGQIDIVGNDLKSDILTDTIQIGDIIWYGSTISSGTDISSDAYIINRVEYNDSNPTDVSRFGEDESDANKDFRVYVTAADGSDAAVKAAASASIRVAGYRKEFLADISQQGSFAGDASGSPSLDGGITFQPKSIITPRTLILFDQAGSGW